MYTAPSDLYKIEASSAVAPRGHLENWTLNFVRLIALVVAGRWFHPSSMTAAEVSTDQLPRYSTQWFYSLSRQPLATVAIWQAWSSLPFPLVAYIAIQS